MNDLNRNPIISIIVPVYNVEQYLPRCIDSILAQTFKGFELLLIDDGSSDTSGRICDEYAFGDNRIKVFHKENGGVSSARNLGLDNAKGEWIAFVDPDDYVSPDFLELGNHADADVVQKPYKVIHDDGREYMSGVKEREIDVVEDFFRFYVQGRSNSLWNKIISVKLIGQNRFDETVKIGEDFLFFLSLIKNLKRYAFSSQGHYCYYVRRDSAMQKVDKDLRKRIIVLFTNLRHVRRITNGMGLPLLGENIV